MNAHFGAVELGELMVERGGSTDPSKHPDTTFALYSIPAFDAGAPEFVEGSAIGSSKKNVEANDILLSRIVPHIRRSWIVGAHDEPIIASSEWIVFRDRRIHPNYLRHFLISDLFHKQFMMTVAGVGGSLLRARPADVARIVVNLPPIDEQRRIAAILDNADGLRQKRKRAIALLDSLTQSIFLEMFGDAGDQQRWVRGTLDGLASIDAPMVDPRKPEYADLLHYGPDRIEKGTGRLMPALSARQDGLTSGKFLCNRDHILYSKIRPYLNKVALCEVECLCSADVYPVTAGDQMDRVFLWFILRSPDFLRYAESCSNRANIPKLNRDQFFGYSTIMPPIELQRAFAERIRGVQSLETSANYHLSKANEAFSSLQHRAFSGQL